MSHEPEKHDTDLPETDTAPEYPKVVRRPEPSPHVRKVIERLIAEGLLEWDDAPVCEQVTPAAIKGQDLSELILEERRSGD